MGKFCSYPGCRTGRRPERAQRTRMGLRQLSVFRIPKDNASLPEEIVPCNSLPGPSIEHAGVSTSCRSNDAIAEQVPTTRRNVAPEEVSTYGEMEMEDRSNGFADHLLESRSETSSICSKADDDVRDFSYGFADPLEISFGENASESKNDLEEEVGEGRVFSMEIVINQLKQSLLPELWCWTMNPSEESSVLFVLIDRHTSRTRLRVIVHNDLSVTIEAFDTKATVRSREIMTSFERIVPFLRRVENEVVCCGVGVEDEARADNCSGFVEATSYCKFVTTPRCIGCKQRRIILMNRGYRRKDAKVRYTRAKYVSKLRQRRYRRLKAKAENLKLQMKRAREECAAISELALNEAISELPPAQQALVQACLSASKITSSKQRRYCFDWVYECVLMRIKSPKLYEHLRARNILPLPCKDTLTRYISKLEIRYGFQNAVFQCLQKRSSRMELVDKRGVLLVDEMSLSEAVNFDRKTMHFNGFVDLGKYTPVEQQNTRADHALVFMFQPFRGKWVQVIGCFLSKNSVTSNVLAKLVLEAVVLLGRSGFHVDVVTMDGAQWNRGVWTLFGINEGQPSCEHPFNPEKRLWMMSDFPHLIKCLRNTLIQHPCFQTPQGRVFLCHFEELLAREAHTKPNLSIAYFLTPAHLNPKGYQKMNVPLAFQLFSDQVRVAMEVYKDDPRCPGLHDCQPTITLIKVVGALIEAMMSRTPANALRPLDTCPQKKAIENFLQYLNDWQQVARKENSPFPISPSTVTGLKVTLGGTLELVEYLQSANYDYLMTARLNQDALERFFGMMRNACGSNDHPDPTLFAQVFRLLCTYSLVKPPKGSNVCGTELLGTLMGTKESIAEQANPRRQFLEKLDALIEIGEMDEASDASRTALSQQDHPYSDTGSQSSYSHLSTHDYDVVRTSDEVQAYIAGYVARKCIRVTQCHACIDCLKSAERCGRDKIVDLMDRYGGLVCPSEELFKLTKSLEEAILNVVGTLAIKEDTLFRIIQRIQETRNLNLVGCPEHKREMTKQVINFYLLMRANFLATSLNRNCDAKKFRTKNLRKKAKL